MEFTSCPRMLHCQLTGSTEIRNRDLHIQSHALSIRPPPLIPDDFALPRRVVTRDSFSCVNISFAAMKNEYIQGCEMLSQHRFQTEKYCVYFMQD